MLLDEVVGGVLGLVSAGLGYGLVPEQVVRLAGPQVVARRFKDAQPVLELWLVWHQEKMTPALARLLEDIASVSQDNT